MQGIRGDSFTLNPKPKVFCDNDVFISSTTINNKVFLVPGNVKDRQSDWFGTRSYCAQHCAEAVTIHSAAENDFFINFININGGTQTWIGAQVVNGNITWSNGEVVDFSNPITAAEFSAAKEPINECIHAYTVNSKWYAYETCTYNLFYVACQRSATWVPCE